MITFTLLYGYFEFQKKIITKLQCCQKFSSLVHLSTLQCTGANRQDGMGRHRQNLKGKNGSAKPYVGRGLVLLF